MEKIYREYKEFTDEEFQQLWKDCLFVFDTNILLNFYRYSKKSIEKKFKII